MKTFLTACTLSSSLCLCSLISAQDHSPEKTLSSSKQKPIIDHLTSLIKTAPKAEKTQQALIKATENKKPNIQQHAWSLFKDVQTQLTNQHLIDALESLGDISQQNPAAIEILEAAKASTDDAVNKALNNYTEKHLNTDKLSKWLPSLFGGNPDTGKTLFYHTPALDKKSQCASCHQGTPESNILGPDLTGVAARYDHNRKDLLTAVVLPSDSIADGYGMVTVEFEKGQITGKILGFQSTGVIVEIDEKPRLIAYNNYQNLSFAPSTMPFHEDDYSLREIRDIIAYLATLTDDSNSPDPADIKATPFTISDLTDEDLDKKIPVSEKQKRLYANNCMACHQAKGEGNESFPPLANSEWVSGDKETLIKIQLLGLSGPIKVRDNIYDGVPMPSNARLTDEDIAHILTYIRTTPDMGNNASAITAQEVATVRASITDFSTPLDASKLKHPDERYKKTHKKAE